VNRLVVDNVVRYFFFATSKVVAMPRPARSDGLDKFQRYRATRRARGLKLLRIWVADPHAPGFREEAQRQADLLRGAPEEGDALDFIEAATETDGAGA
jgi:hypothetical protein